MCGWEETMSCVPFSPSLRPPEPNVAHYNQWKLNMNRREVIKKTCAGLCSCPGLAWAARASAEESAEKPKLQDWQIAFMRARLENLLEILVTTLDEPTLAKVLGKLGAKCGEDFAKRFKGDPEGFWAYAKTMWLDHVDYDKEKGVIHVMEKERTDCNCPLSAFIKLPQSMCSCSVGTQEAIYESLFNRAAKAKVEQSILHGDKRCAFTITLES
jgi:hypothetical protein